MNRKRLSGPGQCILHGYVAERCCKGFESSPMPSFLRAAIRKTLAEDLARAVEAQMADRCSSCGHPVYAVGPYKLCRNLRCERLVEA